MADGGAPVLRERLKKVEERIETAACRAGRARSEISLIAVTKKFPASTTRDAYDLGLRVFGENYVQEFESKRSNLEDLPGAQFHLIGHLQSNKARAAVELFQAIETVDSDKLARRLDACGKPLEVMIEVKLSEEASKAGAAPEALPELIEAIAACPNLRLTGLMTMPPWNQDAEITRPYFRRLAELGRKHGLPKLSMGMSNDLEAAIEEGATHIRVGTALFGARRKD
ncbi:MAG TPA: YggS family pyridoxal phosphate-dependent enzyme [Bryobacteraceae bacterium]